MSNQDKPDYKTHKFFMEFFVSLLLAFILLKILFFWFELFPQIQPFRFQEYNSGIVDFIDYTQYLFDV